MKLKKFVLIMGLLGLASLTVGSNAAMAAESKVYPGNMCHPEFAEDESTFVRSDNGLWRSYTIDKNYITVICPVVKDEIDSTRPVNAYVRLLGRGNGNIYCSMRSYDWRGSNYREGSETSVSGTTFHAVDVFGPATYGGGTLQLRCELPKSAEIRNYAVFE